jgi:hypothetical protein
VNEFTREIQEGEVVRRASGHPIGSLKIEELVNGKKRNHRDE